MRIAALSSHPMSSNVTRAFALLELLATHAEGLHLQEIADLAAIPASAAHRHLTELTEMGYARAGSRQGAYMATTKLVSLAFSILSSRGIVDLAQPILDRLALVSGELVRLAVRDGDRLTFVARAQGARGGLIYDGDMGQEPLLFASASGMAWLSQETDDEAIRLIVRQNMGPPNAIGPGTPANMKDVLLRLAEARGRGYGLVVDSANAGTSAIAAPVMNDQGVVLGTISIAGPSVRLTADRLSALAEPLRDAARELAATRMVAPLSGSGRRGWVLVDDPRPLEGRIQEHPARGSGKAAPAAPRRSTKPSRSTT